MGQLAARPHPTTPPMPGGCRHRARCRDRPAGLDAAAQAQLLALQHDHLAGLLQLGVQAVLRKRGGKSGGVESADGKRISRGKEGPQCQAAEARSSANTSEGPQCQVAEARSSANTSEGPQCQAAEARSSANTSHRQSSLPCPITPRPSSRAPQQRAPPINLTLHCPHFSKVMRRNLEGGGGGASVLASPPLLAPPSSSSSPSLPPAELARRPRLRVRPVWRGASSSSASSAAPSSSAAVGLQGGEVVRAVRVGEGGPSLPNSMDWWPMEAESCTCPLAPAPPLPNPSSLLTCLPPAAPPSRKSAAPTRQPQPQQRPSSARRGRRARPGPHGPGRRPALPRRCPRPGGLPV